MGAATVALFLIPYGSATAERRATGADLLGKPAPPFPSASVNRGSQCLSSYRGKAVLLDFWST